MTKVDIRKFPVSVTSDITRWRYDVNAHCSSVTGESIVFSHEQGPGSKTASSIIEMIFLDHILRCKGKMIKIEVSDNAPVGKNWMTTIALPQYLVDQGLAKIAIIVYLEKNHGKWLADMLLGQFQTKARKSLLISIDDVLSEFEHIERKNGNVRGFAGNPLSSIDFSKVFESLGYETTPDKKFCFEKRRIHFASACAPGTVQYLTEEVKELLGCALPVEKGMVRISASPPTNQDQCELPYEDRYFDVPAARLPKNWASILRRRVVSSSQNMVDLKNDCSLAESGSPFLVVHLNRPVSSSTAVVAARTAKYVGHNGIRFRKHSGHPELWDDLSPRVQRAWPPGYRKMSSRLNVNDEVIPGVDRLKYAPENWVVRLPVILFRDSE